MMSMFSPFDMMFFYWFNFYFLFFMFNFSFFWCLNFNKVLKFVILDYMMKFFKSIKNFKFKFNDNMIITFMFILIFFNLISVFSYNFPMTSQISFVFLMSLSSWLSYNFFMFLYNKNYMISHFVPEGTPFLLIFFLFLIELISSLIRPLTLSIRLVANILAGHLLMILLSSLVFNLKVMFIFYTILCCIEMFVALIQSYIFVTMISLYISDIK